MRIIWWITKQNLICLWRLVYKFSVKIIFPFAFLRLMWEDSKKVALRTKWKLIIRKCRLCGEKHKRSNKTGHSWVGKVIPWELCKRLKLDHTTKWYMHKSELILENETHKFLWDFDKETGHLTPARRPVLMLINQTKKKEKKELVVLWILPFQRTKEWKIKESKRIDKYLDFARERGGGNNPLIWRSR